MERLWSLLSSQECDPTTALELILRPEIGLEGLTTTGHIFRRQFMVMPGATPLILAISVGQVAVVRALVEAGANINAMTRRKETALHIACGANSPDMVQVLLDAGSEVNSFTNDMFSPIYTAASDRSGRPVRLLAQNGANVNTVGHQRFPTPLTLATSLGYAQTVKALLEHGADIHLQGHGGRTAAHQAALGGRLDILPMLMSYGATAYVVGSQTQPSLLSLASQSGNCSLLSYLLDMGSDINELDRSGESALSWSLRLGKLDASRYLLGQGADVNLAAIRSSGFHSAVQVAVAGGQDLFIDFYRGLFDSGYDTSSPATLNIFSKMEGDLQLNCKETIFGRNRSLVNF